MVLRAQNRLLHAPKTRTETDGRLPGGRGIIPNRSSGFVELRAYAWQTALRPAEGVAGYGEAGRKDR